MQRIIPQIYGDVQKLVRRSYLMVASQPRYAQLYKIHQQITSLNKKSPEYSMWDSMAASVGRPLDEFEELVQSFNTSYEKYEQLNSFATSLLTGLTQVKQIDGRGVYAKALSVPILEDLSLVRSHHRKDADKDVCVADMEQTFTILTWLEGITSRANYNSESNS